MRRIVAVMLGVVALATLFSGCRKTSSPAEKQNERVGAEQAETITPEPTAPTSASGGVSGKEQAARSEADCRVVLYVANENMSRQEATVFSELLADMIRTMKSPSWTGGDLRNVALDHLLFRDMLSAWSETSDQVMHPFSAVR
ncbi:MAG: hypothetical protein M3491_08130 [Actinomycetota bacterium]|nr:hypothetical protein [Actinomycetota bacterium]